jgi:TRAP-type C4-dicarboxylate transport system substrate-binding protein
MSIFEMGNALKTGVFDMLNTNNTFYTNLMPEADAIKLARRPVADLRKDGTWDYLDALYNKRLNAHLLARSKGDVPAHLYLRKGAEVPNEPTVAMFKGLKIRSTPIYQPFLTALGSNPVRMAPGDIYTGMQTGVVDGYGWPIDGIDELGLVPVTGYRIDPGVYVVTGEILINMNTWKQLTQRQKAILEFGGKWLETWLPMYEDYEAKASREMQANAGIKVIEFKGGEGEKYNEIAYKAAWDAVMKANPSEGPELNSKFGR